MTTRFERREFPVRPGLSGSGCTRRRPAVRSKFMLEWCFLILLGSLSPTFLLRAKAVAADELTKEQRNQLENRAADMDKQMVPLFLQGKYAEATKLSEQILNILEQLYPKESYPQGHPNLAVGFHNLGGLLRDQGDYPQARIYLQQALIMHRALYPKERYPQGHPDLADSLTNLGSLLKVQGDYRQARGYFQQALDMCRTLFPKEQDPQGHPDLANGLNHFGDLLMAERDYTQAQRYFQQAMDMYQALYPKEKYPHGHPHLAICLNNLGDLLQDQGDYPQARAYYQQALDMYQALHPKEKGSTGPLQCGRKFEQPGPRAQGPEGILAGPRLLPAGHGNVPGALPQSRIASLRSRTSCTEVRGTVRIGACIAMPNQ